MVVRFQGGPGLDEVAVTTHYLLDGLSALGIGREPWHTVWTEHGQALRQRLTDGHGPAGR